MASWRTWLVLAGVLGWVTAADAAEPTLAEQLKSRAQASAGKTPAEKRAVMERAIEDLRRSGILKSALKVGATAPDFELPDATGKSFDSAKARQARALVVTFYRGGWCPYCSLQLRALQKALPEIRGAGAELVAISPQRPDATLSTAEKQHLEFVVVSDVGNQVARRFGLVFDLPKDLEAIYRGVGIDLDQANGPGKWSLPLAATYVVDRAGKIRYAFVDADYKVRAEPAEIVRALKGLGPQGR